ncbi:unnamed protein product [Amoebophrya sp. A25]|nr:unnamed protein product [Amoebophrya sp. A25]|eukprot:GSA25T00003300001.1
MSVCGRAAWGSNVRSVRSAACLAFRQVVLIRISFLLVSILRSFSVHVAALSQAPPSRQTGWSRSPWAERGDSHVRENGDEATSSGEQDDEFEIVDPSYEYSTSREDLLSAEDHDILEGEDSPSSATRTTASAETTSSAPSTSHQHLLRHAERPPQSQFQIVDASGKATGVEGISTTTSSSSGDATRTTTEDSAQLNTGAEKERHQEAQSASNGIVGKLQGERTTPRAAGRAHAQKAVSVSGSADHREDDASSLNAGPSALHQRTSVESEKTESQAEVFLDSSAEATNTTNSTAANAIANAAPGAATISYPAGSTVYHHGGYTPITEGDRTHAQHVIKFAPIIKVNSDNGNPGGRDNMAEMMKMMMDSVGNSQRASQFFANAGAANNNYQTWASQQQSSHQNQKLLDEVHRLESKIQTMRDDLRRQQTGAQLYGGYSGYQNQYNYNNQGTGGVGTTRGIYNNNLPGGGGGQGSTSTGGTIGPNTGSADKRTILRTNAVIQSTVSKALQQSNAMPPDCVYQWQRASVYSAKANELANKYDDEKATSDPAQQQLLLQASEMTHLALTYMKHAIACVNYSTSTSNAGMGMAGGAVPTAPAGGGNPAYNNNYGAPAAGGAAAGSPYNSYQPPPTYNQMNYPPAGGAPYPAAPQVPGTMMPPGVGGAPPYGMNPAYPTGGGGVMPAQSPGGIPSQVPGAGMSSLGPASSTTDAYGNTVAVLPPSVQADPIRLAAEEESGALWSILSRFWYKLTYWIGNVDTPTQEKQAYNAELSNLEMLNQEKDSGMSPRSDDEIVRDIISTQQGLMILHDAALQAEVHVVRKCGWYFLFLMALLFAAGTSYYSHYRYNSWFAVFLPLLACCCFLIPIPPFLGGAFQQERGGGGDGNNFFEGGRGLDDPNMGSTMAGGGNDYGGGGGDQLGDGGYDDQENIGGDVRGRGY